MSQLAVNYNQSQSHTSCSSTPTILKIESITNRFDADVITHLSKSLITTYCKADFGVVPISNVFWPVLCTPVHRWQ